MNNPAETVRNILPAWDAAIMLVDMNAFFASVEQRDRPEWRGRPVAITNGMQGTCIITCSYEARTHGIKTGMRLKHALRLCPDLIRCPADPHRYAGSNRLSPLRTQSGAAYQQRAQVKSR